MNQTYDEKYYQNCCGPISYEDQHFVSFFNRVADRIVTDFHPKTVLDAGCAWGYLVAALRDRGVEAYGIDISDYAISKVRDDIKPYCFIGSLVDDFPLELPQHFDLITNIEVMEHLTPEEGTAAICRLCSLTDTILFSSSPDDFEEKTHINVQQRDYWARLFAQNGIYDKVFYDLRYISPQAICFHRVNDISGIVADYEHIIDQYKYIPKDYYGKIYFDNGNGFSEESHIDFKVEKGKTVSLQIQLPAGCKSVRFDPVENARCLVFNLQAGTEKGPLNIVSTNGTMKDNIFSCRIKDPQIYFEPFGEPCSILEISAIILTMNEEEWGQFGEKIAQKFENKTLANLKAGIKKIRTFINRMGFH